MDDAGSMGDEEVSLKLLKLLTLILSRMPDLLGEMMDLIRQWR